MEPRLPVLDSFSISTPSLSVVISADDSPLPPHVQPQPVPAHVLTVHSLQPRGPAEGASEVGGEAAAAAAPEEEEEQQRELEAALLQRQQQQQRLLHLNSQKQLSQGELRELKALQEREQQQQQQELLLLQQQQQLGELLRRADSRHADRVYRQLGAPPPIQPLADVLQEEDSEGFIKRVSTFETKDFTFWDKLRRHNTQTLIRRWRSYVPSGQEDSAFYLRNIQANVPGLAYSQGNYFKELKTNLAPKEYKLPTTQYVAPPVYVHRRGRSEKRVYDPIRQMARRIYYCTPCSSCC